MPKQVPTLIEYDQANPYRNQNNWPFVSVKKQADAWQAGAFGSVRPLTNDATADAAYVQGCTWRREWDHKHNPKQTRAGVFDVTMVPTEDHRVLGCDLVGRTLTLIRRRQDGRQLIVVGDVGPMADVLKEGIVNDEAHGLELVVSDGFVVETRHKTEVKDAPVPAPGQIFNFPAPAPDTLRANHKELISTKNYGHEMGFSCCFRQHKAHSHCRFLHGYALGFKFTFAALDLSNEGWVVDFGGLKSLKSLLEETFDHKTLVAEDDPQRDEILALAGLGVLSAVLVPATGCEAFARMVYEVTEQWLIDAGFSPRVRLVSVEVSEHGANSAIAQG